MMRFIEKAKIETILANKSFLFFTILKNADI